MLGEKDEKAPDVFLSDDMLDVDDVAGYMPFQSLAFFVRPVENGSLVQENDRAVLYAGVYLFEFGTKEVEDNYRDILGKLTSIYGEPISENRGFLWQGANQTVIHLTNGGAERTNVVRLSYLWTDAQQMIDEAYAVVADEPAVDNSTNTNGL